MIRSTSSGSTAARRWIGRDYRYSHILRSKAGTYDSLFEENVYASRESIVWKWEQKTLRGIVTRWYPDGPSRLLDFACGTGRILSFLEPTAASAVGIDISAAMIEVARTKVRRSKLVVADVTKQDPCLGAPFDLITAFRFFLNAQEDLRRDVMSFFARHLAPGGHVVFNVHLQRNSVPDLVRRILTGLGLRPFAESMSRNEVDDLVTEAGLEIVRTYHWGVLPVPRRQVPFKRLVVLLESCFSRLPFCLPLSRDVVFVCAREGSREPVQIHPRQDEVSTR